MRGGGASPSPSVFQAEWRLLAEAMAAPRTTPDSPAAQLERLDGSECGPDQEEEEEEGKGDQVEALEERLAEGVVVDADVEVDATVEAALAGEQSPASGTQECPHGGRDTESPGLQEKGKRRELTPGEEVSGGFRGQPGRALGQGRAGAAGSARRT